MESFYSSVSDFQAERRLAGAPFHFSLFQGRSSGLAALCGSSAIVKVAAIARPNFFPPRSLRLSGRHRVNAFAIRTSAFLEAESARNFLGHRRCSRLEPVSTLRVDQGNSQRSLFPPRNSSRFAIDPAIGVASCNARESRRSPTVSIASIHDFALYWLCRFSKLRISTVGPSFHRSFPSARTSCVDSELESRPEATPPRYLSRHFAPARRLSYGI